MVAWIKLVVIEMEKREQFQVLFRGWGSFSFMLKNEIQKIGKRKQRHLLRILVLANG